MSLQKIVYLGGPELSEPEAQDLAEQQACEQPFYIERRGIALGWIAASTTLSPPQGGRKEWANGDPVVLPSAVSDQLDRLEADMEKSYALVDGLHEGDALVKLMEEQGFFQRLDGSYQFIGGFSDESDMQGIEQLEFEAQQDQNKVADNLWMKASWLSFDDEDASLRFRFSYGREGLEDVAKDFEREQLTANLAERIFPESKAITQNQSLIAKLSDISQIKTPAFVERIFYFNAPNGGAQFHHDVERGHDGVVYAQLFGSTAWLAMSKPILLDEIIAFLGAAETGDVLRNYFSDSELSDLLAHNKDRSYWSDCLDNRDNEVVEVFLNQIPEFFAFLVNQGYAYILNAGDVILLPQASLADCCWHTVFCLDDYPGEALSFAIRESV